MTSKSHEIAVEALVILLVSFSWTMPSLGQTSSTDTGPEVETTEKKASTLEVKPGSPVIKEKDLWNETGYVHPFVRMPKYVLHDQKAIWTSPFPRTKEDAKWWAIMGMASGVLIATDKHTVNAFPNSKTQVSVSTWGSRFGAAYTLIPMSAGFYFIGTGSHDDRLRETGLIAFETLINSTIVVEALKIVSDRARPLEAGGKGRFEDSPNGRWSSGFPSGHAISTWSLASVVAHQYPHPLIIPIIAYGLATTVVVARVGARQHFPGDVVAGSASGSFSSGLVSARLHQRQLCDETPHT